MPKPPVSLTSKIRVSEALSAVALSWQSQWAQRAMPLFFPDERDALRSAPTGSPSPPRNALQLTRADQPLHEQPGCLHANMDLYKWTGKLLPAVPSELALDAFELAMEIRYLDMQASPYDVTEFGLEPVRIETPEGKRDYAERQAEFSRRAAPLRDSLIQACVAARQTAGVATFAG
ncbi:hypothetical protein [Demequina sp.]|uniref:hypothetical protein n=1 Tax=Demequina sp. TaxID=2050685 RepID=UPI00344F7BE1